MWSGVKYITIAAIKPIVALNLLLVKKSFTATVPHIFVATITAIEIKHISAQTIINVFI